MELDKSTFGDIPSDSIIKVKGARVHNLQNVSVDIPRDSITVITGVSGSGKSSLAFDTIYAEGQRRYVESLSTYARQFLEQMNKPDVDSITGLSPAISIDQKTTSFNPRSTVGTVTEIYDYIRLLFARIAKPFCYKCGASIQSQSPQQIIDYILSGPVGQKVSILAPLVRERKGEHQKELLQMRQSGFVRVRIDGEIFDLSDDLHIDKNKKHNIEVYVDRVILKQDLSQLSTRVSDSVELALKLGNGLLLLETSLDSAPPQETLFSQHFACSTLGCNTSYPPPEPRSFSFNSPVGACEKCNGLGTIEVEQQSVHVKEADVELLLADIPCPECNGSRLRRSALSYTVLGKNIHEISSLPLVKLGPFFETISLTPREHSIIDRTLKEIVTRLNFLNNVGVGYLTLSRGARTLSGGEAQRIRLATQIGSSLVGITYILDEPSIGLHQKDNDQLLLTLQRLRDQGNTVILVEHDQDTIEKADWIIDIGPGAGALGGKIIAVGSLKDIKAEKKSLTGQYLTGATSVPVPAKRRPINPDKLLTLTGVNKNNLKISSVSIPIGLFTCVTGVSGGGKSSLIFDSLYPEIMKKLYRLDIENSGIEKITGLEHFDRVLDIDQKPIGRTPRSNPATYTGLFSIVRDLFSHLPESQIRGYGPGRFSFNAKGGRCESCDGDGVTRIEMHFLPDVFVECEVCRGSRFNQETLQILFKGKSIADVLDFSIQEALSFFENVPLVKYRLKTLTDVGLGYLKLGQGSNTLSGGEAQRVKLSKELSKRGTGRTIYLLDEPSTGLHFDDVRKLVAIMHTLADQGNTVIVIEHNLDIIKSADHLIDLGPGGGDRGGLLVAEGTPESVAKNSKSETGKYLARYLSRTENK